MATAVNEAHAFDLAKKANREPFKVKDLSLADFGRKEIRLAEQEMPGLMALRTQYAGARPLAGLDPEFQAGAMRVRADRQADDFPDDRALGHGLSLSQRLKPTPLNRETHRGPELTTIIGVCRG